MTFPRSTRSSKSRTHTRSTQGAPPDERGCFIFNFVESRQYRASVFLIQQCCDVSFRLCVPRASVSLRLVPSFSLLCLPCFCVFRSRTKVSAGPGAEGLVAGADQYQYFGVVHSLFTSPHTVPSKKVNTAASTLCCAILYP
jgi:hypothetical protein